MTRLQLDVIRYAYMDLKAMVKDHGDPFCMADHLEAAEATLGDMERAFRTELEDLIEEEAHAD